MGSSSDQGGMDRRTFLYSVSAMLAMGALTGCSAVATSGTGAAGTAGAAATAAGTTGSLTFPKDTFTTATETIATASGSRKVTYRLYKDLTYVAHPVDATYQSLGVKVPVSIDGKAVDASSAPILFDIPVGGYMAATSSGGLAVGAGGVPGGGPPSGIPSGTAGGPPPGAARGGNGMSAGMGDNGDNASLALAAGYVVVTAGCRGRNNVDSSGVYFGKAPAAIVDLKSAVRYIRHNKGVMPGNPDWIVSTGVSAGGALSALLGASGDSPLYDKYFEELGAADASDAIFASACYCPITDLQNADGAYEWMFGTVPMSTGQKVDQGQSAQLRAIFDKYQQSLALKGQGAFGTVTGADYADYLMKTYLVPAADKYLGGLSAGARTAYLTQNPWITWANGNARFTWADYVQHVGRMKSLPAFDAFDLSAAENSLFGDAKTNARHFTDFSLRHATGDANAQIASDLPATLNLMDPMYFFGTKNPASAKNWWIRYGTADSNTSLPVIANLALAPQNLGMTVDSLMYWDAGHGANQDPGDFIKWIAARTGWTG